MNGKDMSDKAGVAITPYKANQVGKFGNKFMFSLIQMAAAEEQAAALTASVAEAKTYLSFEMARAIFDLATQEGSKVDTYMIWGKPTDVGKLNMRLLTAMGVLKRHIDDDDNVTYKWTDETIEKMYAYTAELKEDDAAEYTKRFTNRKRLNMRLSEACKAVCALIDAKLSPADLSYTANEAGEMVPTINNAPKQIGGDNKNVQLGSKKPAAGASMSPTMTSLVKIATARHKIPTESKGDDKGDTRDNDVKMGMSDEDFGKIINTVKRAIKAQEGKLTPAMKKQIVSLHLELSKYV